MEIVPLMKINNPIRFLCPDEFPDGIGQVRGCFGPFLRWKLAIEISQFAIVSKFWHPAHLGCQSQSICCGQNDQFTRRNGPMSNLFGRIGSSWLVTMDAANHHHGRTLSTAIEAEPAGFPICAAPSLPE